ncbi:MAG: 30S ribosomal protein S7, partial [bacterium]
MSRKKRDYKRHVQVDPRFGDLVVGKAINIIMDSGKKATAEKALYLALDQIAKKTGADAIEGFHKALNNMKPSVEVRSRRVGGATYQVPVEVRTERRQALAIRWIIDSARKRGEHTMAADHG